MEGKKKKIIGALGAASVGAAAIGVGACYAAAKYLMKVAMDRTMPKVKNIEKAKSHVKGAARKKTPADEGSITSEVAEAAQALAAAESERVEIFGYDGERLVGHWQKVENAKRVIIAMHGWRSSWSKDFGIIAPFWREEGCSVLYAEQRGQNSSGGDYIGFGLTERYDCLEWIRWVNAQSEEALPIYLAGISMGATTVLMTDGFDLPERVHGIMADCGFTSPYAIWKHVVNHNLHLSYGLMGKMASDLCRQKIQMDAKEYSTIEAMKTGKTPVLFIHGTDDYFVPVEMTYENYKACTAPKQLLVVPGAGHGMSYMVDPEAYRAAIKAFWSRFDA